MPAIRANGIGLYYEWHGAVRGSRLHVIAGAGHAAAWEAPAEFNRIVLAFLQSSVVGSGVGTI